jgi:predicted TIM-barrel fold metal-dependent hydrolase
MTGLIDAYAHVGLPRFQSLDDYRGVMAANGIGRAVICSFDSSPDFVEIHRALVEAPDRFRAIGVPLGNDDAEICAGAQAQLEAGFSGLRLTEADLAERPYLLDMVAAADGHALIAGQSSSPAVAERLLAHLEKHPGASIVGCHFAGLADPAVLANGPVRALFEHPGFHVVFSRQGAMPAQAVREWAKAILAVTGWDRILWGSEATVLFWRNETMADAIGWIQELAPTPTQLSAFQAGSADRLYFSRTPDISPLRLPFDPMTRMRPIPATMWARTLPLEQSVAARLVHAWRRSGGGGTLGQYLERHLDETLPDLPTRPAK